MECDSPTWIKYDVPKYEDGQWHYAWPAGCGKCMPCLQKRKRQWSFRLSEELRVSFSAYFVTLTYNDKFVPYDDNGYCANKNDHKHFIKWLKYYEDEETEVISMDEFKRTGSQTKLETGQLKYYATIEYGDFRDRPHWHYILFNVRDINNCMLAWAKQVRISKGVYEPGEAFGRVDIDPRPVTINCIDYVLKYMLKNDAKERDQDRQPEVSFMSKGIGLCVADMEFVNHIRRPENNTVVNQRGTKVGLPRYYRKKFLSEAEIEAKQAYVSKMSKTKHDEQEAELLKEGLNPDTITRMGAENRYNNLKNRRRRNHD